MFSAIMVAAGKGTRMGPNVDKLFLEVAGAPVVAHTWLHLEAVAELQEIIVVVRDGLQGAFQELAAGLALRKPFRLIAGGQERQESVWNGLQALSPNTTVVAIQDGARPCTAPELIRATLEAARVHRFKNARLKSVCTSL